MKYQVLWSRKNRKFIGVGSVPYETDNLASAKIWTRYNSQNADGIVNYMTKWREKANEDDWQVLDVVVAMDESLFI